VCGMEGAQSTVRDRWLWAGGWRGQAPDATRMCGGSSDRPSAAGEGQSAIGGEGGSKTCGRHVVGSGAEAGKQIKIRRYVGVEE
jgi:hypothetical protein